MLDEQKNVYIVRVQQHLFVCKYIVIFTFFIFVIEVVLLHCKYTHFSILNGHISSVHL
jgi:hypothetical protein